MKLGRGEKVGSIDLPPDEELEGVGESFRAISEKLAARSLGRLMAGVTHEVRNPLNAMTIHLELVREHLLRLQQQLARAGGCRAGPGRARRDDARSERRAGASRRHRIRDQAARRSDYRLRALHPARRAAAPPGERRRCSSPKSSRSSSPTRGATASPAGPRSPRRAARAARRSGPAAAGAAQPGAQWLPGDVRWRQADDGRASRRRIAGWR